MYLPAVSLGRMIFTTCKSTGASAGANRHRHGTQVWQGSRRPCREAWRTLLGPQLLWLCQGLCGVALSTTTPAGARAVGGTSHVPVRQVQSSPRARPAPERPHLPSLDPKVAGHRVPRLDPGQLVLSEFAGKQVKEKPRQGHLGLGDSRSQGVPARILPGQQLSHLLLGHDHMLRD